MSRTILKGATSQSIYVEILDSTSTTGGRKTGLAYNTSSLTAYYVRNGGSATAITLATLAAANSAWSSGGFKEVDATNMPGIYRLDVPDAALAAGAGDSVAITLKGATGMAQVSVEIQLTSVNLQDAVRGGMTALPNAAAEAAGGLYTRGTGAGQINQAANGQIDSNITHAAGTAWGSGAITAASIATGAFTSAKFASGAFDAVWTVSVRVLTANTNLNDLSAAGVRSAVGLASANLDTQLDAIPTAVENADALLDRDMSVGTDSGSTTVRTVRQALRATRNKVSISGSTLTVTKEDDSTASWTAALTTDAAANPITAIDPAGP